jgi:putative flippase GtrA
MTVKFSKFTLVAGGVAASDWCVFTLLHFLGIPALPSQGFARLVGGALSFFCNRVWSFKSGKENSLSRQGARFLLLYVASFTLAIVLYWVLYKHLNIGAFKAKVFTDLSCFMFNFVVMNLYVYKAERR